ncbi:hypothetical protein [Streptomyces sp. NPDC046939]|uniref:hypothetical protein n=1 Tax=Streptomyces sp. NPDC046939 TaxID=3155376 RepID=UPI0033F83995
MPPSGRFLIDLDARTHLAYDGAVDEPLKHLLADSLWVRLVDVDRVLTAREELRPGADAAASLGFRGARPENRPDHHQKGITGPRSLIRALLSGAARVTPAPSKDVPARSRPMKGKLVIRKTAVSVSAALALFVAAPVVAWAAPSAPQAAPSAPQADPSAPQQDPVAICKALVALIKVLNLGTPAADLDKLCEPANQPSPSPSTSTSPSPSAPQ